MAYSDIAALAADQDFALRTVACVAVETQGAETKVDPGIWQAAHAWDMAAQPGFGEAYTYARDTDVEKPGENPGVITDAQILSAVQAIGTTEAV